MVLLFNILIPNCGRFFSFRKQVTNLLVKLQHESTNAVCYMIECCIGIVNCPLSVWFGYLTYQWH